MRNKGKGAITENASSRNKGRGVSKGGSTRHVDHRYAQADYYRKIYNALLTSNKK